MATLHGSPWMAIWLLSCAETPSGQALFHYRRLGEYHYGQALFLLALMVAYALCLRPLGFLISTLSFLILGSYILGERKWHIMLPVALIATLAVWYLVQEALGIYMRPLPGILGG